MAAAKKKKKKRGASRTKRPQEKRPSREAESGSLTPSAPGGAANSGDMGGGGSARPWLIWAAWIGLVLVLSTLYLDYRIMPNQSSRAIAVMSVVEHGELRVDRYHEITEDKALVRGHYYSDKAPLSSWATIPFYALWAPLVDHHPQDIRVKIAISVGAYVCGTIPFLLGLLLTFRACRRNLASSRAALLVSLSFFGSFLFIYAGVYFGHMLAGIFLLAAYIQLKERERFFTAGLLLGAGFMAEYPLLLAAACWAAQLALSRKEIRAPLRLLLGFMPAVLIMCIYNLVITGSVLDFPYSHVPHQEYSGIRTHYGLGTPQISAIWGLTFGASRGLFLFSPVLLWFAVLALRALPREGKRQRLMRLLFDPLLGVGVVMVLFFASYYMWWGGWSYGPRHLIPLSMVCVYAGCRLAAQRGVHWQSFIPLAAWGVLLGWATKATHGFLIPDKHRFPIVDPILADFTRGNWSPFNVLTGYVGTSTHMVSVAWALLFVVLVALLAYASRRRP